MLTLSLALTLASLQSQDTPAELIAWTGCLSSTADVLAEGTEPTATVVTAAFGSCGAEEAAMRRYWARTITSAAADRLMASTRQGFIEALTSRVVQTRNPRAARGSALTADIVALNRRWAGCLGTASARFAESTLTLSGVVEAAFESCAVEERALLDTLVRRYENGQTTFDVLKNDSRLTMERLTREAWAAQGRSARQR